MLPSSGSFSANEKQGTETCLKPKNLLICIHLGSSMRTRPFIPCLKLKCWAFCNKFIACTKSAKVKFFSKCKIILDHYRPTKFHSQCRSNLKHNYPSVRALSCIKFKSVSITFIKFPKGGAAQSWTLSCSCRSCMTRKVWKIGKRIHRTGHLFYQCWG